MRLADFILANTEPILGEWEVFARGIWPGEAATDPATLRDHAEEVLRAAAADMKSAQSEAQQSDKSRGKGGTGFSSGQIDRASKAHGALRHGSGFDLAAVVAEYRALRASVIRLRRESHPEPDAHDLDDLTRFSESIDQSLTEAVVAFTKLMEQERRAALDEQARLGRELRAMNEALLVSSVRQHELTEQAEKDRRTIAASERELSDFFETASIGLHWVGPDGMILRANPAELNLLGYGHADGRKEYVGRHIAEFHVDQPVIEDILARLLRGETLRDRPARLRCKDGSIRHVLINSCAFFDNGQFVHGRCFTHDITSSMLAEQALRESEERFRMLADNMAQFAWTADDKGCIYWYNRRWYDYTGTTPEEMQGWGWKQVHHPDHIERVVERLQRSWDTGEPWEDTFPLRGKDGQYRWFLSRARAIRDEAGNILRWFGTNTDITEQREMEVQISRQALTLVELNRRKDEFLAMLSHELRNPLAPILNAVQLLRLQQDRSPLQTEAHGIIVRQVAQMARLVDDLLEVSRITTGRIHLQQDRVDLRGIVVRGIETTQSQSGQKGQSVAHALPAEPVWVYGDAARLEQVVVNLLNNASKYTDQGGHIWLELQREGEAAVLRIRDTGVGIAPELLPRIFDLFTQADKSLDRAQGGLGIGLALVQSLITMHGGRVEALSTPGQGSEFIVTLPLHLSPYVLAIVPADDVPPPARALKVLVVDDNMDNAKGMAMLLRTFGHEARMAHDGASAIQAALEFVPEVVLLDIGLPVVSGYEVAKWIRQEPALQDVVLVALTGYGQESDKQRSREAGFDHHLVKPADFALVQRILSAVAEKSPRLGTGEGK